MSIKAQCRCGAQFMAKPELAGRTVKCPTCGQAFQVPKPAPAADQSTFQVACPCGKIYNVPWAMAGRPVRCKACGQQFVVPRAPAATRHAAKVPAASVPDPLSGGGPLDDLGDLSSFVGAMPSSSFPSQLPAATAYGTQAAAARPTGKKQGGNSIKTVSIILGSLVTLAIIGIAIGTFVFFPFGSGYATPEAVWEAQKTASENQDWRMLYNTLTIESREQLVGVLAWTAQMLATSDAGMAAILKTHGVETSASSPDLASPEGFVKLFSQMQQQVDSAAASIQDKEAFFIDTMSYFTEKRDEMQQKLGNQQMTMMPSSQELKEVVVEGDSAHGTQTVSVMGNTVDMPIEFRKVDGSWLIHAPMQRGSQRSVSASAPSTMQAAPFAGPANDLASADGSRTIAPSSVLSSSTSPQDTEQQIIQRLDALYDYKLRRRKPEDGPPSIPFRNHKAYLRDESGAITKVKLDYTPASDADLGPISELSSIELLILDGTDVTDAGLAHLTKLKNLKYLQLMYTRVTDQGVVHLKQMSQLEVLNLRRTQISAAGVNELQMALPNCRIGLPDAD